MRSPGFPRLFSVHTQQATVTCDRTKVLTKSFRLANFLTLKCKYSLTTLLLTACRHNDSQTVLLQRESSDEHLNNQPQLTGKNSSRSTGPFGGWCSDDGVAF